MSLNAETDLQKWLISSINDPIAKILLKNSHLTRPQLETLLIDILAEKLLDRRMIYEEKAHLRLLKSGVSRGAFNRTLRQSRANVIRSVYTIILLGYLGVLESPRMEPYLELANKLHEFAEAYKTMAQEGPDSLTQLNLMASLKNQLENGLKQLTDPKTLSKTS